MTKASFVLTLVAGVLVGPLLAETPEFERKLINPDTLYKSRYFSQAVSTRGGRTIQVSGQWACDKNGKLQGAGDLKAQAELACQNLKTLLEASGATPADVTNVNVYVVNYKQADLAAIEAGFTACFGSERNFASTLIGVQALARDGMLFEIDAVAVVKD
jgi:enamine deaminase RidA (YjgF/YER057c/UK114 family)